eukprot:TRINITY_DN3343_c0_g2_i1.p1 TRINITY_DN3343_c0_g2~~TRINITY_DN3343_c0_g2_i1.p1  ORF type:complete len:240 (-),score=5.79 TRINITY_DN3343_c0_g2_i1:192-911(-)
MSPSICTCDRPKILFPSTPTALSSHCYLWFKSNSIHQYTLQSGAHSERPPYNPKQTSVQNQFAVTMFSSDRPECEVQKRAVCDHKRENVIKDFPSLLVFSRQIFSDLHQVHQKSSHLVLWYTLTSPVEEVKKSLQKSTLAFCQVVDQCRNYLTTVKSAVETNDLHAYRERRVERKEELVLGFAKRQTKGGHHGSLGVVLLVNGTVILTKLSWGEAAGGECSALVLCLALAKKCYKCVDL